MLGASAKYKKLIYFDVIMDPGITDVRVVEDGVLVCQYCSEPATDSRYVTGLLIDSTYLISSCDEHSDIDVY